MPMEGEAAARRRGDLEGEEGALSPSNLDKLEVRDHPSVAARPPWCEPRKLKGFGCVLLAAFIWVVSSYWVQDLESQGMTPLLVTSLANSMFTVLLPASLLRDWIARRRRSGLGEDESELLVRNGHQSSSSGEGKAEGAEVLGKEGGAGTKPRGFVARRKRVFLLSLSVWPIWFSCLYIYNWSFMLTSVMSNTILSIGGTSLFTYFLEMRVMKSSFSWTKLGAIASCIAGTVLWCVGNLSQGGEDGKEKVDTKHALLGNFLCLLSASLYSVVSIIIGKYLPESGEAEMSYFWGFTGLINLSVMMPINLILCLAGKNGMQNLPAKLYGMVMLKGLMDNLLSNYMWAYAVLFIGPTSANVGMSIETPMVVIIDLVTRNATYLSNAKSTVLNVVGALTIMVGFFGLSL